MRGETIEIRKSTEGDLSQLLTLFAWGRAQQLDSGNLHQWGPGYPGEDTLRREIHDGLSYVIVRGEEIVGTFMLLEGADPTYKHIYDGQWLNDAPYVTVHRVASSGKVSGITAMAVDFAKRRCANVRIDTHRDNQAMQKAILRCGFTYCGIIHVADGSERLAYHLDCTKNELY